MEELVQATVEEHGRYQLEFKFDYTLLDERSTNYKIVTYLFFPRSFGVNQYTYAASDFYHSLQNYVRLKTPTFSLGDIRVVSNVATAASTATLGGTRLGAPTG